jgi:proteic killer suppression protein
VIKTFGNASTARFFHTGKNKFSGMDARTATARYDLLDSTDRVEDLFAVGRLRLHKLSGNLSEFWSIDINGRWRLLFIFKDGDAFEITIADTH